MPTAAPTHRIPGETLMPTPREFRDQVWAHSLDAVLKGEKREPTPEERKRANDMATSYLESKGYNPYKIAGEGEKVDKDIKFPETGGFTP